MAISAKVLADSSFRDTRLITLEVELHRFILSENNTHKAQSRNIQSSRAIPVLRQLEQIADNPAMPVEYRYNASGMVAGELLSKEDEEKAKDVILWMRDCCLKGVKELHEIGLAKQWSNRYVEPWMFTKGVVTATEEAWEAMFKLRVHYAAQPEIRELFKAIQKAIEGSKTNILKAGDIHLPYFGKSGRFGSWEDEVGLSKQDAVAISLSCIAQVSYRKLDDTLEKAKHVVEMLNLPKDGVFPEDPSHLSPTEHIAIAAEVPSKDLSGNFHSKDFVQYRKLLELGIENEYMGRE